MNVEQIDTLHAVHEEAITTHPRGEKLKAVWIVAKPILQLVKGLLFLKPKWQMTIDVLIMEVDIITGN